MTKSLNDIAHELTLIKLNKDAESFWTHQHTAEIYQETHAQLLKELMNAYETTDEHHLV